MKLHYRKYGSGPPLIILHGLFGSSDNWVSFARGIEDRFTIFIPDLRNHGQSPHSDIHDYDSMMNDIKILADDLRLEKFILAGHSMGGKTAINFAINYPERLNGLLIADISPFSHIDSANTDLSLHKSILNFILSSDLSGINSRNDVGEMLKKEIKPEKVRDLVLKNLQRDSDSTFSWKINAEALDKNFSRIMGSVIQSDLKIKYITGFPVYFLKGEYSDYLTSEDFTAIQRIFPGAELIAVPGAGHWIHADNPGFVRECFLKFLDL